MARIFRQLYSRRNKDGEVVRKKARKWYIEYLDGEGRRVRVPGFVDRRATEQLAANLERDAERIRAGIMTAAESTGAATTLADHLGEYIRAVVSPRSSEKHVRITRGRIEAVLAGCGWRYASDAAADQLTGWLASQRPAMSLQTSNHYARAVKSMFQWLTDRGRIPSNPLASVRAVNPEPDRRRTRRALTAAEFARLIEATRNSPVMLHGLTGPRRAALYTVAAYTGLRSSELASLTLASLDLGERPTVEVEARYSKRRRRDRLPLHGDLAELLREYVTTVEDVLFPGDWSPHHGADLLRHDLAMAGIPFEDQAGRRFDFHSLRVQFITSLARAGVGLMVGQRLARHSTPHLTSSVYAQVDEQDLSAAANRLPSPLTPLLTETPAGSASTQADGNEKSR